MLFNYERLLPFAYNNKAVEAKVVLGSPENVRADGIIQIVPHKSAPGFNTQERTWTEWGLSQLGLGDKAHRVSCTTEMPAGPVNAVSIAKEVTRSLQELDRQECGSAVISPIVLEGISAEVIAQGLLGGLQQFLKETTWGYLKVVTFSHNLDRSAYQALLDEYQTNHQAKITDNIRALESLAPPKDQEWGW